MLILAMFGIVFMAGILVGMGAMVCLGIAREERRRSIRSDPPGPAASATRALVGFHNRPGPVNSGNGRSSRINRSDSEWRHAA